MVVNGVHIVYFAFPSVGGVVLYESMDTASIVLAGLVTYGLSAKHGDLALRIGPAALLAVIGGL